jgi:Tfp pilus assembly protein PilP
MTPSPLSLAHQQPPRIDRLFPYVLLATLLSACHDNAPPDLQPWMAQVRSQTRPAPLPEITLPAMPARWLPDASAADPFGLHLAADQGPATDPAIEIPRQVSAPVILPAIRAVAILRRPGAARALLQIGTRMLLVVPGDALPGISGHVLAIDERAVRLELAGREVRLDLGMGGAGPHDSPAGEPA